MAGAEQSGAPAGPMRRKIRSAAANGSGPVDDRVVRVWRQVTARALKAASALNVKVTGFVEAQVEPDDLANVPADDDMILLLESERGEVGLALVGADMLAALIEVQTIGRVTDRAPPRRRPTSVDAALVGPVLDRLLSAADPALAAGGLTDPVTDYRFAMLAEAGTPPTLALADILHRCLTLDLGIEGGIRSGRLRLLVPDLGASEEQKASNRAEWTNKIARAVLASDLVLDARLGRLRLPVEEVMGLGVGDCLPLSQDDVDGILLVASHGGAVARARLGQAGGFRAVKVQSASPGETASEWSGPRIGQPATWPEPGDMSVGALHDFPIATDGAEPEAQGLAAGLGSDEPG